MTHILDEQTLQRCVDGELSAAEQQALLRQLERSPAGWREVALAFIEHQLWAQAGHDYLHEPSPPQAVAETPEPPVRADRSRLRNVMLVASTLLAVGLGYVGGSRSFWSGGASPSTSVVTSQKPDNSQHKDMALASTNPQVPPRLEKKRDRRTLIPVMQVEVIPEGQNAQPIKLPVYDADELAACGPWTPPQLPADVLQRLKDQGVQVQQESHFYSVPNKQNRKLIVPVNTVRFHQPLQ